MYKCKLTAIACAAAGMAFSCASFGADAITAASLKPTTTDAPVLEGQRTLAKRGQEGLPANLDAVTSASVVPEKFRQTDYTPRGFSDKKGKKSVLFVLDDPRHESVTYDLCVTAMKFFEKKGFEVALRDLTWIFHQKRASAQLAGFPKRGRRFF